MMTDILIKEKDGTRGFYVPWLPEKIECASGGAVVATYDIMNRGPVEIPTGAGLRDVQWGGVFPGANRADLGLLRTEYYEPTYYHSMLEDWRRSGTILTLLVYGHPINLDVYLSDYNGTAVGGFGDWEYTVKFKEKRELTLWPILPEKTAVAAATTAASADQNAEPQRAATTGTTYTIKKGDSPWKIAAQQLGKGTRWPEIIQLNQEILESTAQKYGKHCTVNDPHIYAGTVITLPAK